MAVVILTDGSEWESGDPERPYKGVRHRRLIPEEHRRAEQLARHVDNNARRVQMGMHPLPLPARFYDNPVAARKARRRLEEKRIVRKYDLTHGHDVAWEDDDASPDTAELARARLEMGKPLDALQTLIGCSKAVKRLSWACHDALRDPDQPWKFTLAPQAHEITVIYREGDSRRKATLQELLDRAGVTNPISLTSSAADPRQLMLSVCREARGIISSAIEAARAMRELKLADDFRNMLVQEVQKESPDCAARISARLLRAMSQNPETADLVPMLATEREEAHA